MDLTPGPRRLGENEMEPSRRAAYDAVNELIRQDPEARMWRAVAVALAAALPIERRAGREDAAKANTALLDALRRLRDHWYGWPRWTEAAATVDVLIDAFAEGQHPRTPGEDVTP